MASACIIYLMVPGPDGVPIQRRASVAQSNLQPTQSLLLTQLMRHLPNLGIVLITSLESFPMSEPLFLGPGRLLFGLFQLHLGRLKFDLDPI